jgi:DHA1 family bicyclomycin/chloramphenicol resistance-like MFS transporter
MREVLTHRQVLLATGALTLIFAMLFSSLLSSQAVFGQIYGKGDSFPLWFGLMAAISASSSLINAMIVVRFGMRWVVKWALVGQALLTVVFLLVQLAVQDGAPPFALTFLWMTSVFFIAGLGIGNLNAIALEPMGHISGMAASLVSAVSTLASVLLAAPVGQAFDGTVLPLSLGTLGLGALALILVLAIREDVP